MITSTTPRTWRDLQRDVAQVLAECGFTVQIEKRLRTVRGDVVIDVYAEEKVKGRKYQILCECKFWKKRIPQSAIHGFRTVIADIGANVGYLISTAGFQSGAFAASDLTNLQLVTWPQFQAAFEETWYEQHFSPVIADRLDALLSYTEPLLPLWFHQLPENNKRAYIALKKKHDIFGWIIMAFTPYLRMLNDVPIPELPINERLAAQSSKLKYIPAEILQATGYREFFDLAIEHGEKIITEFRAIRHRNDLGASE